MKMSNKVYDALKWITLIMLPAVATFYDTLSILWGWPYAKEITGSITAFATLFGVCLGISTANYNKEVL